MGTAQKIFLGLLLVVYFLTTSAWVLPGTAPNEFSKGQTIEVKVNKMTSPRTQLPYPYYSLPFCEPPEGIKDDTRETLGEMLMGDKIVNSAYKHVYFFFLLHIY